MKHYDMDAINFFRPSPTDEYLANPHKGCCTFQRFNGDPLYSSSAWSEEGPLDGALAKGNKATGIPGYSPRIVFPEGYLPSTVAYCRWFWEKFEPIQGQHDFSVIDRAMEACRERGQTLAVRLMPFGFVTAGQPALPSWYDDRYPKTAFRDWKVKVPVYESSEYLELWGGLVREFARRYDANPLLETIDVAFIGPWGEGDGRCCQEQCDRFAELWQKAFSHTPRLALIAGNPEDGDQMRASVSRGGGWRADSFGDLRWQCSQSDVRLSWNHMYACYPRRVPEAGATDAWRRAPVHFETWDVPMHQYQLQFDLDFILEQGLKYHTTYFMPKSTALPAPWLDKLLAFCKKIGYRFIFRQATISRKVSPGGTILFEAWIENVGVAPLYRRYDFALRLRQGAREEIIKFDEVDVRSWLPGDAWLEKIIRLPGGFRPGQIEVSAGLLDPVTHAARIRFAVTERFGDNWVFLGNVECV
ncbi:MAG: DUF4832 domain-containing protein [Kiritimatiellae bacterium]|nr:DUF4832 domain-containing protein [Kiritimatiellia bacterium]